MLIYCKCRTVCTYYKHVMFLLYYKPSVMLLSLILCGSATSSILKHARVTSSSQRQTVATSEKNDDHERAFQRVTLPSDGISYAFDIADVMFEMMQRVSGTTATINGKMWPPKCLMDTIELMLQRCLAKRSAVDTNECVKEIMILIHEEINTHRDLENGKTQTPVTTSTIKKSCTTHPGTRSQWTRIPLTTSSYRDITATSTGTTRPETRSYRPRLPLTTSTCRDIVTTCMYTTYLETRNSPSRLPLPLHRGVTPQPPVRALRARKHAANGHGLQ